MSDKKADLSKLDDDALAKREADLAEQRTALREEQRAVEVEKQIRAATASMSPDAKAALGISVGGSVGSNGEAS